MNIQRITKTDHNNNGNIKFFTKLKNAIGSAAWMVAELFLKEDKNKKNALGGYVGNTLAGEMQFTNPGEVISYFANSNINTQVYSFQDRDGPSTIADNVDLLLKEDKINKDADSGYVGRTAGTINFKSLDAVMSYLTNVNEFSRTYTFQDRNGTIADHIDLALKEDIANKDAEDGYPSLENWNLVIKSTAVGNISSYITNANTSFPKTYTLQNRHGILADDTDIANVNNTFLDYLDKYTYDNNENGIVDNAEDSLRLDGQLPTYYATAAALEFKEDKANKDTSGGYVGKTLQKINFKNNANTFTSLLENANTAIRTYTFPNYDGTPVLANAGKQIIVPHTGHASTSVLTATNVTPQTYTLPSGVSGILSLEGHAHSGVDITSGTIDGDRLPAISATKKGGVPLTGTPSGKYLKDDGTWATVAAGVGDMTKAVYDTTNNAKVDVAEYADDSGLLGGLDSTYHRSRSNHTGAQAQSTITNLVSDLALKQTIANRNAEDGYAGLEDYKIMFYDNSGFVLSYILNNNTNSQTYTLPNATGTVVLEDNLSILTSKTISGSANTITNLNASNLSSGTVADARLSANVPYVGKATTTGDFLIGFGAQWAVRTTAQALSVLKAIEGPASATDNAITRYDLTTGKLVQNSGITIDDSNNIALPAVGSNLQTGIIYKGASRFLHTFYKGGGVVGNLFFGIGAGNFTMDGTGNSFQANSNFGMGNDTLASLTTGFNNMGFGNLALNGVTTGSDNVAIGLQSFEKLGTGSKNTGLGTRAGHFNIGDFSTFIGTDSGYGASGCYGNANMAAGYKALFALTNGYYNIAIGYQANDIGTTGGSNIVIGADCDPSSATVSNELNIGNVIKGTGMYGTGAIGINTVPNANAVFDIVSTTKAFLPPRMTTTQKNAIASPTAGMVVYDSTLNKLCVYTTAWQTITSS